MSGNTKTNPTFDMREDKDFYVEWFSGTGKGGQHRNKHQNSCRLYHLPTGEMESRQGRERTKNLEDAKKALIKKLDEGKMKQRFGVERKIRSEQVGSGMRGDKRRTYRFQDDQVVDHELNTSARCSKIMRGHFDLLW